MHARLLRVPVAVVLLAPLSGCLVYRVVSAPVKLAATTVVVAGETTGAVVTTTGKVATSAVRATGNVTAGGLEATSRLARAGMVTFADEASGAIVRIPWSRGLTLAGAGTTAKIDTARRALQIVRAGRAVYSATRRPSAAFALDSGDVIRLVNS